MRGEMYLKAIWFEWESKTPT